MENKFPCSECEGSGRAPINAQACGDDDCPFEPEGTNKPCIDCTDRHPPCPTCKGSRFMALGVEVKTASSHPVPMNDMGLPEPSVHYRPLSAEELEELLRDLHSENDIDGMICALIYVPAAQEIIKFNGSPVKLIPWKEGK